MSEPTTTPAGDGLTLKREVAAALTTIDKRILNDTKLERSEVIRFAANQLVLRLEKLIYTSPLGLFEVEYPAGPWEHFRAVYFKRFALGRWFLRRRPVRMHYERRSAAVSFPESTRVFPEELGKPVILVRGEHFDDH